MKKIFFCVSLALTGLMTACVDKNEAVDAESKPDWLGGSIYQELTDPDQSKLTGTFTTYLRLINDIPGLSETLNRTGSMTVFPANDAAFEQFFKNNPWNVTSYEQLTTAQKQLLINSSMLENALLVGMLSNMTNGDAVDKGKVLKHETRVKLTDSVRYVSPADASQLPQNNKYWDRFRQKGIHMVADASRPMMVHFTREYMLENDIKTVGENSDFSILTGTPYSDGMAYVFDDRIINKDVTCQNGYIHQMEKVIVPPGNMAEVLHQEEDTKYFSHILDYFAAPYFSEAAQSVTNDYNAVALQQGKEQIDSIFELSYLNNQTRPVDPDGVPVTSGLLTFDPGWNQYSQTASTATVDYATNDAGAMFIPVDQAVEEFFLEGGEGAYLIDIYGQYKGTENNKEHLMENLDSLHSKRSEILTYFLNNLMKQSFANTVPSKFSTIKNDVQENMDMRLSKIQKTADGKYDIAIANNGVIYKLNTMVAPDRYQSVMAPSSTYDDMQVMNWAITDPTATLNVGFSYYLLAMSSNFGFFVPDDAAFGKIDYFYVNPVSLAKDQPEVLHFYHDPTKKPTLRCDKYAYDPATNMRGDRIGSVAVTDVKTQLVDILNYHTVVLKAGEKIGQNGKHYYKTKHGAEIYVDFQPTDSVVKSGMQLDNGEAPSHVTRTYNEKNGDTYRLDCVIQPTTNSVSKTLQNNASRFSDFYDICASFGAEKELLAWAGISDQQTAYGTTPQDAYMIFTTDRGKVTASCLDENVKMFNTYNYTLYAPNNDAMQKAHTDYGLPTWDEIKSLKDTYESYDDDSEEKQNAQAKAYAMIRALRDFVRYHFQSISLYADKQTSSATDTVPYQSLCMDATGISIDLKVMLGDDKITVIDGGGYQHVVDVNSSLLSNKMARDYWFDANRKSAKSIYTSSFCVVHEIDEPFFFKSSKRYDSAWKTDAAREQTTKTYLKLKKENKL